MTPTCTRRAMTAACAGLIGASWMRTGPAQQAPAVGSDERWIVTNSYVAEIVVALGGAARIVAIGGGANYRSKAVLAYRIQTDQQAAYTPAYTDFNALVQYSGRVKSDRIRYKLQLNIDNLTDNQDPQAVNGGQPVPGNAAQSILPIVDGVVPFYILPEPRRFSLSATFTF